MAWDDAQAIEDFETLQLEDYGEDVSFIDGVTGVSTDIKVIRPTSIPGLTTFQGSSTSQNRTRVEVLVSRGSAGKSDIRADVDKIRIKLVPNDAHMKTLTVKSVRNEYGVWRVGLG